MPLYSDHFYHSLLRKYTTAFGSLFSNISVTRSNSAGDELHREVVPVTQSKKSKFVARLIQDANLDSKPAIKLPRIAYEHTTFTYAPDRKITSKRQFKEFTSVNDPVKRIYHPVPYDIGFSVAVFTKTQDEMLQIIEQIVPFFTPDYTLHVKDITPVGGEFDLPIDLLSVNPDDSYEGSFDDRRMIIWELEFVLRGYFFGPVRDASLIYTVRTEFYDKETNQPLETIQIKATDIISPEEYTEVVSYEMYDGSESNKSILFMTKGRPYSFTLVLKDADGVPIDLTPYTVAGTTRKDVGATLITDFDITVANQADPDLIGMVTLDLSVLKTSALELGYGIFSITLDDGVSTATILDGITYVKELVSLEFNLTLPPLDDGIFNLTEEVD